MRGIILAILLVLFSAKASFAQEGENIEFREKLSQMLFRTERSIKLLREQISESQTAPFLPDLYSQLADLLSQKSNTLYYIQMERQKGAAQADDKTLSPVVGAQQEAIGVYRLILKDFPNYGKRAQLLYKYAVALKSIDESVEFIRLGSQLLREHPGSAEAMRVRLLLGQHYFDRKDFSPALDLFRAAATATDVYERNLAKYRIGLIHIAREQFGDALVQFEQVVQDQSLREQDNPYSVSLKTRSVKSDLKREALIDSIRAYTHVYAKDPDAVGYYSKLAPTELHFQEVIEKLALRYIYLKKYDSAISLLRALSERTADPQKVINIYQEVLLMIPLRERTDIPVDEMKFLLDTYNKWASSFQLTPVTLDQSYTFFEKQIRDLGTTSHSLGKEESDTQRKTMFLKRARDYYALYLGFFGQTKNSMKIASNLADVHYALQDFMRSGDYYLRTFLGEFGAVADGSKPLLIENAILCLQKPGKYSFYENMRLRGLLIKALSSYIAFDKNAKSDPKIHFQLIKTEYEQGFFPEVLETLYSYMTRFNKAPQAVDAGEMILDYCNTKSDYGCLVSWIDRLSTLKLASPSFPAFKAKLGKMRQLARARLVDEKAKTADGYDAFSQGKGYLTTAMNSEDAELSNIALRQALAKSQREQDIDTFFKAAEAVASKESKPDKKAEILRSMVREYTKIGAFYRALQVLELIQNNTQFPAATRAEAFNERVGTALLLKDVQLISRFASDPMWQKAPPQLKTRVRDQLSDAIGSGSPDAEKAAKLVVRLGTTDEALLSLYKFQHQMDSSLRSRVVTEVRSRCAQNRKKPFCKWTEMAAADSQRDLLIKDLGSGPATVQSIEPRGQKLLAAAQAYSKLEGSGDPHLETVLSLRNHEIYAAFAAFLARAAKENDELGSVLLQKAKESSATAKAYLTRCQSIISKSVQVNRASAYCDHGGAPSLQSVLYFSESVDEAPRVDSEKSSIVELQKEVFAAKNNAQQLVALGREYLSQGYYRHSAAVSSYGITAAKEEEDAFRTILGCSLLKMGLYTEANFHLREGSEVGGLKGKCTGELKAIREES